MKLALQALGLFYLFGAWVLVREVRMARFMDQALEKLTGKPEPDRHRVWYMAATALLYGSAGIALLFLHRWALWAFGLGLLAQAIWYPLAWSRADAEERADKLRWSRARNAAIFSAAAFAFAAYAYRLGYLG